MAQAPGRQFLHVTNGTSTTRGLEAAGISGRMSIWADPLHSGPVPGGLTDAALIDVRTRHLEGAASDARDATADAVNDMRRWRAVIEAHEAYDELVLWFEHDLFDQLNLIQLLSFVSERLPPPVRVSLICIGSFPGRPRFKGLGELTPEELAPLLDTRQPVTPDQYSLARRAWAAFRASSPEPLDALRRTDTAALPFLAPALTRLLQEYPWTRDGLSRSERRLLHLAGASPAPALSAVFHGMDEGEQAYYVTDLSLRDEAESLADTSPALLTLTPRVAVSSFTRLLSLTDTGRAVLAGEQDRVRLCGIDRWVGGTHIEGDGPVWRWDDEDDRVRRM